MHYELVYIVSSVLPETEHPAVQEEILAYFSQIKAKIITEPYSLGRKRLAYPIANQKHGFYVALEFEVDDKAGLKDLDTAMKHNKNVLRHLVIKKSAVSPDSREAKQADKTKEPIKADKPTPPVADQPKSADPKTEDKPKIDLDDLDQKLDQILKKEQ
jgi:ribosomal protein S6